MWVPVNRQVINQKTGRRKERRDPHYQAPSLTNKFDFLLIQQMQMFIGDYIPHRQILIELIEVFHHNSIREKNLFLQRSLMLNYHALKYPFPYRVTPLVFL